MCVFAEFKKRIYIEIKSKNKSNMTKEKQCKLNYFNIIKHDFFLYLEEF